MKGRIKPVLEYSAALLVLLAAWWYVSGPMGMPAYLLPSPASVAELLWSMLMNGKLLPHLAFTMQNIVIGLVVGSVFGVLLAYAFFKTPALSDYLEGPLVVIQTAPKIALAPLIIIWFGLGLTAKIVLIFSLVFFPVFAGALAGFRSIDSRLHDLAQLMNLSRFQRFLRIDLPAALPGIFVGVKIGAIQALVGAILAEWMSGSDGLGYLMTFATATYKTPLLFGAVLLTAFLGLAMHAILNEIEARFLSWSTPNEH
ncbi:NitT/TauT family transport system permease protein [Cohaesibacter marisflavi]|uniref:NitT/TauT family transport system permease protein n=1 Tax=Cohaesibacter marisflavi TaxID=655353 RepID=A0A1I5DHE7_9HYPH|nr:ABC transporter permease [Cohaesibacter marisflavi]SFN98557.1 NitT/TauT family transport system permease protein [Cohaesibacter marisflavi]